jgi:hypothetical protein
MQDGQIDAVEFCLQRGCPVTILQAFRFCFYSCRPNLKLARLLLSRFPICDTSVGSGTVRVLSSTERRIMYFLVSLYALSLVKQLLGASRAWLVGVVVITQYILIVVILINAVSKLLIQFVSIAVEIIRMIAHPSMSAGWRCGVRGSEDCAVVAGPHRACRVTVGTYWSRSPSSRFM